MVFFSLNSKHLVTKRSNYSNEMW